MDNLGKQEMNNLDSKLDGDCSCLVDNNVSPSNGKLFYS